MHDDKLTEQNYGFDDPYWTTPFEHVAAQLLHSGAHVLEIGCGVGRMVNRALKRNASQVVAVEPRSKITERMLESFPLCNSASKDGRLIVIQGTWPDAYSDRFLSTFDIVFAQSSLHFLPKAERTLAYAAIRRSLRNSGVFALAMRSVDSSWLARGEAELQDSADNRYLCPDGEVRSFFYVETLLQELSEAGFSVAPTDCTPRLIHAYAVRDEWSVWYEIIARPRSDG